MPVFAQVLRRAQLGLKAAAAGAAGEDDEGGEGDGAKGKKPEGKPKAKAKAKGRPKMKAKAKAKGRGKSKKVEKIQRTMLRRQVKSVPRRMGRKTRWMRRWQRIQKGQVRWNQGEVVWRGCKVQHAYPTIFLRMTAKRNLSRRRWWMKEVKT